jgi:hypothetical protein
LDFFQENEMRKHIKCEDGTPRAGKIIPLAITRIIEVPARQAANDSRPGKLNYLGKSRKPKEKKSPPRVGIERRIHATTGKFIGDGEKLTVFVWLDDEDVPAGTATND